MDDDAVDDMLEGTGFSGEGIKRALRDHERLALLPHLTFGELEFLAQCIEARNGYAADTMANSLLTAVREAQYSITRGDDVEG